LCSHDVSAQNLHAHEGTGGKDRARSISSMMPVTRASALWSGLLVTTRPASTPTQLNVMSSTTQQRRASVA
jgi:hypothetical protein